MPTEIGRIKKYLKGFDFDSLFIEELGWDNHDSTLDVNIDGTIHKPIENITLENVSIKARSGMTFRWVNGLKLKNVKSKSSKGKPISHTDCKNVQIGAN